MRTARKTVRRLAVPAVVGALAIAGAACEVEDDDPDVVQQPVDDDDPDVVDEGDTTIVDPGDGDGDGDDADTGDGGTEGDTEG